MLGAALPRAMSDTIHLILRARSPAQMMRVNTAPYSAGVRSFVLRRGRLSVCTGANQPMHFFPTFPARIAAPVYRERPKHTLVSLVSTSTLYELSGSLYHRYTAPFAICASFVYTAAELAAVTFPSGSDRIISFFISSYCLRAVGSSSMLMMFSTSGGRLP